MFIGGIILMIAGFVGVLVCAKIRQQPLAVVCAVAMLVGLGLYTYRYMNPAPSRAAEIYAMAVADKIGQTLKASDGGKRVIWIADANNTGSNVLKSSLEAFKKAYGSEAELKTVSMGNDGMSMSAPAAQFDEIFNGLDDSCAVIIDTMLPMDLQKAKFIKFVKGAKAPMIFLTPSASAMEKGALVDAAIRRGVISGAVVGKSGNRNPEFEPSDSDLPGAFNELYILVDKDNLNNNKSAFAL